AHSSYCPGRCRRHRCRCGPLPCRGGAGRRPRAGGQGARPRPQGPVGAGLPAQRRRAGGRAGQRPGAPHRPPRWAPPGGTAAGGRPRRGGGRTARDRGLADLRPGPVRLLLPDDRQGQPDRAPDVRRRGAPLAEGGPRGHPAWRADPQRRTPRVRPQRAPLRQHRRHPRRPARAARGVARAGLGLPGRQDPAPAPRRLAAGRQPEGHLRLDPRSPQRRGHRLGRARTDVGHRVRRDHPRRAQPDPSGAQLRLAAGRGRRRSRACQGAVRHLEADLDVLAERGHRRGGPGVGRGTGRTLPLLGPARRRQRAAQGPAPARAVRSHPHRREGAGRVAVDHDEQPRRAGRPRPERRPGHPPPGV
ncbi:MAG: hypothetical protein AVDCRST_MAG24-1035, partial [uncultured Nocardioidaceae bacterium]